MKQVCAIFLVAATLVGCSNNQERRIAIASKNFTEQVILGELLAQQVEAKTNLKVERRLNLGGTFICHQGIIAGEIDIYPEYTGTAFTAILKNQPIKDSKVVFQKVKQAYADQFGLSVTAPLGFNNTFAIIIRQQDAQQLGITTISDAAKYTSKWRAGFGYEFTQRADGFEGLAKTYGLKFAEPPRSMDLGLTYRAIADKQVDLIAGDSTAGLISSLNLFVLKDDKNYFPPYDATIIVRKATLEKHPELNKVLQSLEGKISESDMRRLNFMVDGEKRDAKEVVREFRRSRNL
ncbi:glycine betaine ABC transporter substrate-binding protein [Pseudanabaena sp. PCC 6802]|uniref:glycine betaine ABC transporter substrate-binding protein n=1 Tax=Pseudanabaena sp. PCC 6802 TaxID=118173 RepID=UPI000476C62C